ncbi:geranylfarnesyl diphosphate synthase [Natronobacterium gregoryi]|uniref:Geranylgeranyl pyrophosphate synthase n=2 Tax=Natronobacterium gregoryi TaxID=44930 RepID=L0AL05_NATGS|nr:polyprenyl synthetase family protein [Natronobacterium gregoryi]AFZ73725.1 geranylgeranyl pyrophosphate synthase [Natronobacterium gregoryi SP2]ELY67685.1 Polyprenyl synthetase [Natronobacterium gregoryi SP2]PLK19591.1 polyprenyl synthetase family protein [Natronobacterium gregoryi SP2]SFJ02047.1 farnesyl-diphosphate synthase /geranylgeranyl-diphosphate synthase [Natronobacterium gregoryi]
MTTSETREETVLEAVGKRRELVNDAVPEELPVARPERLYEASRYLLDAGGKRLRPTILLTTAEALADVDPLSVEYREFPTVDEDVGEIDLMGAAVSVEVIQSFTLIHDDIMDDDDLRRGVPAVHQEYDLETAILAGDTLYSKAFEIMLETGAEPSQAVEALDVLANTCTQICEGQALDVDFERRDDVVPEEYLEMVEQKTAVLYAASASLPAILMGADDDVVDALYGYGLDVGRAFQIHDDVLDLTVPSDELGKQRGSDLVENKQTLITVHAREHGVDIDELVDTDDVEAVTEAEVDDAVAHLETVGSIDYANDKARELVDRGKDRLEVLPDNEAHDLLDELADYLIERGY